MKLENQLTNLKLSQRLEELGVKQESYFWWIDYCGKKYEIGTKKEMKQCRIFRYVQNHYSAFTVAELGEMLPNNLDDHKWELQITKVFDNTWYTSYYDKINKKYIHYQAKTEADARAKMLICILENKLTKKNNS